MADTALAAPHAHRGLLSDRARLAAAMPTKRSGKGSSTIAPTYTEWRPHAAALLVRQGISADFMREKE
jgi:hypothetical protein